MGLRTVTMAFVYGHAASLVHDGRLHALLDLLLTHLRATDACAWWIHVCGCHA